MTDFRLPVLPKYREIRTFVKQYITVPAITVVVATYIVFGIATALLCIGGLTHVVVGTLLYVLDGIGTYLAARAIRLGWQEAYAALIPATTVAGAVLVLYALLKLGWLVLIGVGLIVIMAYVLNDLNKPHQPRMSATSETTEPGPTRTDVTVEFGEDDSQP